MIADCRVSMQAQLQQLEDRYTALEGVAHAYVSGAGGEGIASLVSGSQLPGTHNGATREIRWLRIKLCILASFCAKLRQQSGAIKQFEVVA